MGRWDAIATDLLAAATGAGVSVDRSFVAAGPPPIVCRTITVHLASTREVPLGTPDPFGPVASITRLRYVVTFGADCIPVIDADGNQPDASAMTAAITAMLADAALIHDALLDPVFSDEAAVTCQQVTVEDGEPFGPSGGKAGWRWPVAVVLT